MRLNGGIIGVSNEPTTRKAQGMFSFAERALNVLYGQFPVFANTFTLKNLFDVQPQPTYKSVSVAGQETTPNGVFLKPDGTKMYVIGSASDNVRQYTLSTPYDVSTATYDSVTFAVTQDTNPQGLFFKSDGTKMYVVGSTNDRVYQYTLSSAWDVSSATYDNLSLLITSQDNTPLDLYFDATGTILLICGDQFDKVYKYTLSTAWDISTATYANNFFGTSNQTVTPNGVFADPSGTTIYVAGSAENRIFAYDLTTAWDLSTATYSDKYIFSSDIATPSGLYISDNGTNLYWTDGTNDVVRQYFLRNPWNIYQNVGLIQTKYVGANTSNPQ